jgi:hypothetical protein
MVVLDYHINLVIAFVSNMPTGKLMFILLKLGCRNFGVILWK